MHTGTKTLKAVHEDAGYIITKIDFPKRVFRKYPEKYLNENISYFYGHPFPHHIEVMEVLMDRGSELITSVRHPDDVAESWARRYELGYSRHRPIKLSEQYEVWLEKVVPFATVYRIEDFKAKVNKYEGVDYQGPLPDISNVREQVMEVWNASSAYGQHCKNAAR